MGEVLKRISPGHGRGWWKVQPSADPVDGAAPFNNSSQSAQFLAKLVDRRLWDVVTRSGPIPLPTSLVYGELRRAIARVSGAATPVALEAPSTDGYTSF